MIFKVDIDNDSLLCIITIVGFGGGVLVMGLAFVSCVIKFKIVDGCTCMSFGNIGIVIGSTAGPLLITCAY